MSLDSLGKKTHFSNVLRLFEASTNIWPEGKQLALPVAVQTLNHNVFINKFFTTHSLPFDARAQQAYVKRFFRWLSLPESLQLQYPTRILSGRDSIALRQSLYLDFIFNTSEAPAVIDGINDSLKGSKASKPSVVVAPSTHETFCDWIGVASSDNTRRGPFARWLEDAGLAAPVLTRAANETSVVIGYNNSTIITPEAMVYGLILEFCSPFETGKYIKQSLPISKIESSFTTKSLFIKPGECQKILNNAITKGYITGIGANFTIDPIAFAAKLSAQLPLPNPAWLPDVDLTIDNAIDPKDLADLASIPEDDCKFNSGSPFMDAVEFATQSKRQRIREKAFGDRVSEAYNNTCLITGVRFRAPFGKACFGDSAHIVPHQGKDLEGNRVYGKSDVSNGLFLDKFWHWCFDQGWFTLEDKLLNPKNPVLVLKLATLAADPKFGHEFDRFEDYDDLVINKSRLPNKSDQWPNRDALEWHRNNVFADSRI